MWVPQLGQQANREKRPAPAPTIRTTPPSMSPDKLRELLSGVESGSTDVETALNALKNLPFDDLGFARVDHHRELRQGVPEVVFGEGKTVEQIAGVAGSLLGAGQSVLITRLAANRAYALIEQFPQIQYNELARIAYFDTEKPIWRNTEPVLVVTAGTSDLPVAAEALQTLSSCAMRAEGVYDVGVAGLHRIVSQLDKLQKAPAIIVCAGMEGALASVVGGLVSCPVIAVPTSIGYGAALGGIAALLGMMSSCAAGLTVVNIDNGFGAAMALVRMFPTNPPLAKS